MKKLAPEILRQRLVIEGYYSVPVDEATIRSYFQKVCTALSLRFYAEPIVFSPAGMGREGNQGYDAFVPLIDSGISGYFWSANKFLSIVIYTCKSFDAEKAVAVTREFFDMTATDHFEF